MASAAQQETNDPIAPTPTRERILDVSEELFAEHGFSGAAMRDIASRAGLTAASLYNHFPGKRSLYEAVLERGLKPLFEVLDELAESDWTPEHFDRMTDVLIRQLARRPRVPRLVMYEALTGGTQLARLARDWLRPLYGRGLETFRQSRSLQGWTEEEVPLLLMALYHLVLGYFASAPLLSELSTGDSLSDRAVDEQRRFARKVVRRLLTSGAAEVP